MTATNEVQQICSGWGLTPAPDVPETDWRVWLEHYRNPELPLPEERTCPQCGKPMALRSGKYGAFWGCTGYPSCKETMAAMTSLVRRVDKLEAEHDAATANALSRITRHLDDDTLAALAGPSERWAGCSDGDLEAIADGRRDPPASVLEYELLAWAWDRVRELATAEELTLLGLA